MSLGLTYIYMYVDPSTQTVEKMVCFTPFGVTERIDSDWVPSSRAKSGIDSLTGDKVYLVDWDTDFVPMDAEDDGGEHKAVQLFDEGNLTEEACKQYGKLVMDPTTAEESDEMKAAIERLNNQ